MATGKTGKLLLFVGAAIAAVAGALQATANAKDLETINPPIILGLTLLGLAIGLLHKKENENETTHFLVAALLLIITATGAAKLVYLDQLTAGLHFGIGTILQTIATNLSLLIAPAALIAAVRAVFSAPQKTK